MQNYSVCHCFLRVSSHALHLLPVISGANLHDKSAQNCADCVADFPAEAKKKKKKQWFYNPQQRILLQNPQQYITCGFFILHRKTVHNPQISTAYG